MDGLSPTPEDRLIAAGATISRRSGKVRGEANDGPPSAAQPFALIAPLMRDERAIGVRRWVGGEGAFPRPKLTTVSGAPGVSKTTAVIGWGIGLAAGVPIEGIINPPRPERVLFGLIEDEVDEAHRRAHAAASAFADADHLRERVNENLRLVDLSDAVPFFHVTAEGELIETPGFHRLEETVKAFRPALLVLDPLIELHGAEENSNSALRAVLRRLRKLASDHDLALVLIHHETKSAEGTALQRLRGAGSIGGAIRSLLSLRVMTADEAKEYSIPEEAADLYVKVETGKQQYARKQKPRWLVTEERQLANGDRAHLLRPWTPPATDITPEMLAKALIALRKGHAGEPCSESPGASAFFSRALEPIGIPKSARGKVLNDFMRAGEAEVRRWRDASARKTFKRIWVAGNTFEGWEE